MSEYRTAHDLSQLDDAAPDERFLLRADELRSWAARCTDRVEQERQACLKIVEDHLRLLVEERRLDPILLMQSVAEGIRRRSELPDAETALR